MSLSRNSLLDCTSLGAIEDVKQLISEGANVDQADISGRTPLMVAAAMKNHVLGRLLFAGGASVNAQDQRGWSALNFAAQNPDVEFIRFLSHSNCSQEFVDVYGNSSLFRAVFNYRSDPSSIEELLSMGANANLKNKTDVSPRDLSNNIGNYDSKYLFQRLP
mgnify:CR=1 FL=1